MRAMPGLRVIRPADANEVAQAWRVHIDGDGPTALILTRQELPVLGGTAERAPEGVPRGAYVLVDEEGDGLDLVLIGTGSEVSLCVGAPRPRSTACRCGSCRCRRGTCSPRSPTTTASRCCPPACPRSRSRPARRFGWERYADDVVAIDRFGASAPGRRRPGELGFTPENVAARARALLAENGATSMSSQSAIARLNDFGQSPWYDNLARPLLTGGGLAELVDDDGIRGVTSNPTILEKAIGAGEGYDEQLAKCAKDGLSIEDTYWAVVLDDIVAAADVLRPVYDAHGRRRRLRVGRGVAEARARHRRHDRAGAVRCFDRGRPART